MAEPGEARRCDAGLHPVPASWHPPRGCSACRKLAAQERAIEAILRAAPQVPRQRALSALERAAPALTTLRRIAAHLEEHPEALRAGSSAAPVGVLRLVSELRAAGSTEVALPRCAGCGRQAPLKQRGPGGRICRRCAYASRAATCAGCGRERPIVGRSERGEPLCKTCRTNERRRWRRCGRCGTLAPIEAIQAGAPIGRCCYIRPVRRCRLCGVRRRIADGKRPLPWCAECAERPHTACSACGGPARLPRAGEPPRCAHCAHRDPEPCARCGELTIARGADAEPCCERCYERPLGRCGRCGRQAPIARLARDGEPALCDSCYRGPMLRCAGCGRLRPCQGVRKGEPRCEACRPERLRECAHCGKQRRITANWVEGPVCRRCYDRALAAKGDCPGCGERRRLMRYEGFSERLCADCAGAPRTHVCGDCGEEDAFYERGRCARCVLARRLTALLGERPHREALGLEPLFAALATARAPRVMLRWLDESAGADILRRIATCELACSHEALDSLPESPAVRFVEHLLVASGTLPARDPALARLERFVDDFLASEQCAPFEQLLRPYASWIVLRPLRDRSRTRPISDRAIHHARRDLRTAASFLAWLAQQGRSLADCRQTDVDRWLTEHPNARGATKRFARWATERRLIPKLEVPAGSRSRAGPGASPEERQATARRLLLGPGIENRDRVAGALLVLYAQPLERIARLTRDHVLIEDGTVSLRLGPTPLQLAEPLASHVRQLAHSDQARTSSPGARRPNATAAGDTAWLFPGRNLGRPIAPLALGNRLRKLGIRCAATRSAAMLQLCGEVPAPVVADILGLHVNTAVRWAGIAGRPWADYLTSRAEADALKSHA